MQDLKKLFKKPSPKGFTLVEFIVILTIFVIMASIALFDFKGFQDNVSLNNLAHDIALTVRQAQVFGWSTTSQGSQSGAPVALSANNNPLRYPDGVYFEFNQNPVNGIYKYQPDIVLYTKGTASDDPTQGYFDASSGSLDTVVDTVKIQGTDYISDICWSYNEPDLTNFTSSGTATACINNSLAQNKQDVSVSFSRPRPEASFFAGSGGGQSSISSAGVTGQQVYMGIYVRPNDPNNKAVHVITISQIGEIGVQ